MNNPKKNGFSRYKISRFMSLGMLSNPHELISSKKNYGRPIRKDSRRGQTGRFNKVGHRSNKG